MPRARHRQALMRLCRLAIAIGLGLGVGATLLGLLAPWFAPLELINHFRPFLLGGAAVLLGLAWLVGRHLMRAAATSLAATNLALALLPLTYGATDAAGRSPDLRVVTFNMWNKGARARDTITFLRESGADVIVLQEAGAAGPIVSALRDTYPHAVPCPPARCELRLLAKQAFSESGRHARSDDNPPLVWARFVRNGFSYDAVGVHLAYPFDPERQEAHVEWLSAFLAQRRHSVVLAGDLNLTPFSWKLAKLATSAGLRRHGTLLMSFPAHEWVPAVLLDNVLSTTDFATVTIRTGPHLGSDHLPVIADLARIGR
ncbi:MAG TPA: endonuclease/exonuclease/phosphatase family protein [Beijerinckiaceae bacterium]|nr:endonuclease/exonuclease/phosphatase family protein [Beijerinckiaceae bacterium]